MKRRHKIAIGALVAGLLLRFRFLFVPIFMAVNVAENALFVHIGAEKGFTPETIGLAFLFGYAMYYVVNNYEVLARKARGRR